MRFTACLAFLTALLAQTEIAKMLASKQTQIASAFSGLEGDVSASFGAGNRVLFQIDNATNIPAVKDAVAKFLGLSAWSKKFEADTGSFSWYAEGTSSYMTGVNFGITITGDDMAAGDLIVLKEERLVKQTHFKVYAPQ